MISYSFKQKIKLFVNTNDKYDMITYLLKRDAVHLTEIPQNRIRLHQISHFFWSQAQDTTFPHLITVIALMLKRLKFENNDIYSIVFLQNLNFFKWQGEFSFIDLHLIQSIDFANINIYPLSRFFQQFSENFIHVGTNTNSIAF